MREPSKRARTTERRSDMRYRFPEWSNGVFRWVLVGTPVLVLAALGVLMIFVRTPWRRDQWLAVDQPVMFDHRHHVRDDAIDCRYCHSDAFRSAYAGIPSTDKCMGCHNQIWNQSPMLEPVRRSFFSGMPIPWNRVHRVPDFVYFDHSIHVTRGIGCVSCHGRVDEMARVYQVESLTMDFCLDCHREPERHLVPLAAITNTHDERRSPEEGVALARFYGTRHVTNCTACHR